MTGLHERLGRAVRIVPPGHLAWTPEGLALMGLVHTTTSDALHVQVEHDVQAALWAVVTTL